MDRDEILEKSRKENKDRDFVGLEAKVKGIQIAVKVGLLMCCLMTCLRIALTGIVDYSAWPVYFSILATISFVEYYKLHRWYDLFVGILYLTACAAFLVLFLRNPLGVQ